MVNIMKGSYSEYDVREALGGRPVVAAYQVTGSPTM